MKRARSLSASASEEPPNSDSTEEEEEEEEDKLLLDDWQRRYDKLPPTRHAARLLIACLTYHVYCMYCVYTCTTEVRTIHNVRGYGFVTLLTQL